MEKNASLPFGSFNSLALFTGLCLGASPAAGIAAENSVKNSEETLVVEAAPPSLYSPGASADPKFNKPLVDTTRTITVIPEQVIKDQGPQKRSRRRGVLCRGEWQLNHRGCHLYARRGYL